MASPYSDLPDYAFWRRAVATLPSSAIDLMGGTEPGFRIETGDAVMTTGSCFAQHISRYLTAAGFNLLVTETAHPLAPPESALAHNYGIFTARYGNIYTPRQLLQLFQRAFARFSPMEEIWTYEGRLVDPYRPRIQPEGFFSVEELRRDRKQHLAAVRRAFEELDVLIFTLGLTEAWRSKLDGAVFPVVPGAAGGEFNSTRHEFHNFTVEEISADLLQFIDELRQVNSAAKILLTVSPVPLVATAEPRHVVISTVYSKSVLRVACETVCRCRELVTYFPSYEIITSSFSRGGYFAADAREVTEAGVSHVMQTFFRHLTTGGDAANVTKRPRKAASTSKSDAMAEAVAVMCDEEVLDINRREERRAAREARRRSRANLRQ